MNPAAEILNIQDLVIAFGGLRAVDNVSVHVNQGEFLGVIGPNGAGKTTFFNSITGNLVPTSGSIVFEGRSIVRKTPAQISNLGISRTFQNIRIFPKMTVLENVSTALHSIPQYSVLSAVLGLPVVKREQQRVENAAKEFIDILGLSEHAKKQAGALAYGLQRRLEIARALASSPKLLLLDEPAAGMNNDECNELIGLLCWLHQNFNLTTIIIEHHIDIVLRCCSRIYVLNLGRVLAEGNPGEIQTNPDVIKAYLGERRRK